MLRLTYAGSSQFVEASAKSRRRANREKSRYLSRWKARSRLEQTWTFCAFFTSSVSGQSDSHMREVTRQDTVESLLRPVHLLKVLQSLVVTWCENAKRSARLSIWLTSTLPVSTTCCR